MWYTRMLRTVVWVMQCTAFTAACGKSNLTSSRTLRTALDCPMATLSKADESHLPFCHVMAGRGAPDVSQASTTDMPSITVLSRGPLVMLGAMPAKGESGAS